MIILAAGEGTRMRTRTPKMLHEVCGRTMLGHIIAAARELNPDRLVVVVSDARGQVADWLRAQCPDADLVVQGRRGGTGHAVRTVIEALGVIHGTVVVTYSDTPLLRGQTLARLAGEHESSGAAITALTARAASPTGYGRIIRDAAGRVTGIVEEADASAEQRAVTEINTGMYAFDGDLLADAVKRVPSDTATGEEYLTDVLSILHVDGYRVGTVWCEDFDEIQGVNDQAQLAKARRLLNERLLRQWMSAGVTVLDPATTWLDVGVALEAGVSLGPGTQLEGGTTVTAGATIGPGSVLRDTAVGADATVIQSVCEQAVIGAGAVVGPFAHLTAGTEVPPGAQVEGGAVATAGPGGAGGPRDAAGGSGRLRNGDTDLAHGKGELGQ
ncbi:MAG: bifunctional N-acetylglucosamine-1-phosphate uridyltransferase/glucosamine-1-phosphate acetyltransferase [Streptosporangiaceae bacterium]